MMAKIEWYREILEQEPGSRVFFPLAKLLVAADRPDEALVTLRRGLDRHPDFLEARLELISLLREQGETVSADCAREVGEVIKLFKAYPAFWDAWAATEQGGDLALAIRFVGQAAMSPELSFRQVFERGLDAPSSLSLRSAPAAEPSLPDAAPGLSVDAATERERATAHPPLPGSLAQTETFSLREAAVPAVRSAAEEGDEPVTLRTRSMADVLAEQGDIAGALEIYQELEAAAPTPEEAAVLRERVMALASRIGTPSETTDPGERRGAGPDMTGEEAPAEAASQSKMLHLLETLADRLEARARA